MILSYRGSSPACSPSLVGARHRKGGKTYRAKLSPVAVGAPSPRKAHLVDGKKSNFVTVHVKGLAAGTTYPWQVHVLPAGVTYPSEPGATQGAIDTRFRYDTLTANEDGNASAKGQSTSLDWARTAIT